MQLCKIHLASAKKASVHPYIFFFMFLSTKKKKRPDWKCIFGSKNKVTFKTAVSIRLVVLPSLVCKDPSREKYTQHSLDAVPERQVSGRVRSVAGSRK